MMQELSYVKVLYIDLIDNERCSLIPRHLIPLKCRPGSMSDLLFRVFICRPGSMSDLLFRVFMRLMTVRYLQFFTLHGFDRKVVAAESISFLYNVQCSILNERFSKGRKVISDKSTGLMPAAHPLMERAPGS
jgi:hypothetical protein